MMPQEYFTPSFDLHQGDALDVLRTLPDCSVDAVVTDPPYGLKFMGRKWDYNVPPTEVWAECLRVLKPGGHLLAFAGTRTQHHMAVRIEDAGFEVRDMIAWVYGSGFPKSLDVSKAIDKAAAVEREVIGVNYDYLRRKPNGMKTAGATAYGYSQSQYETDARITAPATDAARQWAGWGTALKPAMEPITVARKPLIGTVAENVLAHGTGAINIDGCRVAASAEDIMCPGRWPANLLHDGSEEVTEPLGRAARFFYSAKASKQDRGAENRHPTVKPTDLMRYLCRLVTPPGGVVLDPFMGSGSTGKAALLEGLRFVGVEREAEYVEIAAARIKAVANPQQEMIV